MPFLTKQKGAHASPLFVLLFALFFFGCIGTVPYAFAFAHPFLHFVECFAESLQMDDFSFPQVAEHIFDARVGTDGNEVFVCDTRALFGIDVGDKIGDRVTQARHIDGLRRCVLAEQDRQRAVLADCYRAYPPRAICAFCHTGTYSISLAEPG